MLADPAALARMSSNGLEATKNEFNWEKEKLKLVDLYRSIFQGATERISHKEPSLTEASE
jgi:hypothetical protein